MKKSSAVKKSAVLSTLKIAQSADPRSDILKAVGDLGHINVYNNQILGATFIRPEKIGNIYRPHANIDEDKWQGKVFLVLKTGPLVFMDDERNKFHGQSVESGQWVVVRNSDGLDMEIRGVRCKIFEDTVLKLRVDHPEDIY